MTDTSPPVPPVGSVPPPPPAQPVYGQPQAYGTQPYAYGPPTNTLSIIALIAAFVFPLAGIICGHIALSQIRRTGEGGHGLALAGTVLGYVFTGLTFLFIVAYIVIIAVVVGAHTAGGFSSY